MGDRFSVQRYHLVSRLDQVCDLACALTRSHPSWFVGTTYSYGIIQAALVKQGLSTPATLSFVGSLTVACIAALALVNARVIRALGARRTGLLGVGLLGLGEILSSFTTRSELPLCLTRL